MALGIGEIRGFPARKGASRTVNGVKQFDLYSSKSDSGRTYTFVGMIEGKDLIFQIQEMPKRTPVDTYVFNGAKSGLDLSQSDVDGIVDDYARLMTDSTTTADSAEPAPRPVAVTTTIREKEVEDVTLTLTETLNSPIGSVINPTGYQTYYAVTSKDITLVGQNVTEYSSVFPRAYAGTSLADANTSFDNIVEYLESVKKAVQQTYEYGNYEIRFTYMTDFSGDAIADSGYVEILNPNNLKEGADGLSISKLYKEGDTVFYSDEYGIREFGKITLDEQNDLIILEEYIDAAVEPRADPNPPILTPAVGAMDVYSWGWYRDNSPESNWSPFTTVRMIECYTIPNTQGRILGIEDSDIWGIPSGAVHFKVKDGYAVKVRIMTQNKGYLGNTLKELPESGISFDGALDALDSEIFGSNQDFDYEDTEQVEVIMTHNDYLSIDIDSEVKGIANFRLTSGGENMLNNAARNIDDETFLQIVAIQKLGEDGKINFESGDVGQDGDGDDDDEETKISWLPIVVAGVLIIGIMYLVFSTGGGEE